MSFQEEIREAVDEAKAPGTFNILEAIQERAYPKQKISVYLDENSAYQAAVIKERLVEIDKTLTKSKGNEELEKERNDLIEQQEAHMQKLGESVFTFHLRGISEGKREELYSKAKKKYPIEYEAQSQLAALTGQSQERVQKESPERDALFTEYLWLECIEKIEDVNGNIQDSFTYTDVKEMRNAMPIASISSLNGAIEKLRISTAVFMQETGEDFLAKP